MENIPKTTKVTTPASNLATSSRPGGISISPPAYGIESIDRAPGETAPEPRREQPFGASIQMKTAPSTSGDDTGSKPALLRNQTGLPDALKSGVESLSGLALDDVRVHYNSSKPAALQALAYTQGTDIHIGPGQEHHVPHEAWHVVQQKEGRVKPTQRHAKGAAINNDPYLEAEADSMGQKAFTASFSEPAVHLPLTQLQKAAYDGHDPQTGHPQKSPARLAGEAVIQRCEELTGLFIGIVVFLMLIVLGRLGINRLFGKKGGKTPTLSQEPNLPEEELALDILEKPDVKDKVEKAAVDNSGDVEASANQLARDPSVVREVPAPSNRFPGTPHRLVDHDLTEEERQAGRRSAVDLLEHRMRNPPVPIREERPRVPAVRYQLPRPPQRNENRRTGIHTLSDYRSDSGRGPLGNGSSGMGMLNNNNGTMLEPPRTENPTPSQDEQPPRTLVLRLRGPSQQNGEQGPSNSNESSSSQVEAPVRNISPNPELAQNIDVDPNLIQAYIANILGGGWGGEAELAVLAQSFGVIFVVHHYGGDGVYQYTYRVGDNGPEFELRHGPGHYDAFVNGRLVRIRGDGHCMFAAAFYAIVGRYPTADEIETLRWIAASGLSREQIQQIIVDLQSQAQEGNLFGVSSRLRRSLQQESRQSESRQKEPVKTRSPEEVRRDTERTRSGFLRGLETREKQKNNVPENRVQPSSEVVPIPVPFVAEPHINEPRREVPPEPIPELRVEPRLIPRVEPIPEPRVEPSPVPQLSQYQIRQREQLRLERLEREHQASERAENREDALGTINYYFAIIHRLLHSGKVTEEQQEILLKLQQKLTYMLEGIYNKGVSNESVQAIKNYVIRLASREISAATQLAPSSEQTGGEDGVWTGAIDEILLTNWILERDEHGMSASSAQQVARGIIAHNGRTSGGGTDYTYQGHTVFHISHGKQDGKDGCTVFFIVTENGVVIVGIGAHKTSSSYTLDWQVGGWNKGGKSVEL